MAWTYSDWITLTGSARLTRLRSHIKEVTDALENDGVADDGTSYNPTRLGALLTTLLQREQDIAGALGGGGIFSVPTKRGD